MKKSRPVFNGAENITALIYLCSLSTVMMYLLCRDHMLICTVLMTALCSGIYMLFYAFRNRRLISFVVFLAVAMGVMLTVSAVSAAEGGWALMSFVYTASEYFDPLLAAGSIVLFSFVLAFPVYYFTVKLPRPCFLLLPALAPFILCSGTVGTLPAGLTAFVAAAYFAAIMGVSRAEYPAESQYIEDKKARKERLAAMGLFGVLAAGLLLLIPRSSITPYADYLDANRLRAMPFYGGGGLAGFMSNSSMNTGNNQPSEDILFYVVTDTPSMIITQSFDTYRGKEGWTYLKSGDFNYGIDGWQIEQRLLNYNRLEYLLKKGAEEGKLSDYADDLLKLPDLPMNSLVGTTMTLQIADASNTTVVRHPAGTYNARIANRDDIVYRNEKDELFTASPFGRQARYTLDFYGKPTDPEFARYLSGLSGTEYLALLDAAATEDVIDETMTLAFKNAYYSALNYRVNTMDAAITPEIQELADTITAGLDNDYDKAMAIEAWFGEGGFTYDLSFVPQELTAEYFLFTSRRGICSDFATASTLLLRAAGIPARYTEGFVMKTDLASIDLYGRYEVRANQAHAFASAYIPGNGWIEVDGTKYAAVANAGIEFQIRAMYVLAAVGVVAALCVVFRKRLSEAVFVIGYKFRRGSKKVRALYFRTRKLACGITGVNPKTATAGEVREIIARILLLDKEAGEITDAADAVFYGGSAEKIDHKRLYNDYKLIRAARRNRK